jgi:hypothetical protein
MSSGIAEPKPGPYDPAMVSRPHSGRRALVLATAAVVWAAGFTGWALTASAYSDGQTLLEANPETTVRVAVAIPLVVSAIVWVLLSTACRTHSRAARVAGIVVASLLVAFAVVTGFTIGLFVLPGALALVFAAVYTPVGAQA